MYLRLFNDIFWSEGTVFRHVEYVDARLRGAIIRFTNALDGGHKALESPRSILQILKNQAPKSTLE